MKKIFYIIFFILSIILFKVDSASAQTPTPTCTTTPPTNTGIVTLSADATAGTYKVWSRMKAASSTNNSFYLQIDSSCPVLVQTSSTSFVWVPNANTVNLTAGNHVIKVIGNQPGVGVDKILMTKNLTCIPDNTVPPVPNNYAGLNCPAEIIASPTVGPTDSTPPAISNIYASEVTGTTAKINWILDEKSSGQIQYGTTTSYGQTSTMQACCTYDYHIQTISGLTTGVTYHYKVTSTDASGNTASSNDCTFTTGGTQTTFICTGTGPTITPTNTPTPTPTLTPTKTPTPTITPTIPPSSTILKFNSVKLHGIGTGGDNTNPNLNGNMNPLTTSRTLTVELIDSGGNIMPAAVGNITYKSTTGDFSGSIVADPSLPGGNYLIKVKAPGYLKRQLTGITTITTANTNTLPNAVLISGDINNDNALSILDYNIIMDCYSELLDPRNCSDPNKKASADLDNDGNVNKNDYNLFLRELSIVSGD